MFHESVMKHNSKCDFKELPPMHFNN